MVSLLRRRPVRGMPEPQAQALVEELDEALSTAITQEIFTKADIAELQGTVQGLNERLQGENKLLRCMITATLTIIVAIGVQLLFM